MNTKASNELTVVDDQPKSIKTPLVAGSAPKAIVPVDFDGAYRIAKVVVAAHMAPATLETVEKTMVAIMHGLEIGLTPMNALQSIAVINGRPTIWGDGAVGLIRASGLLEYMEEFYEHEDTPEMKAVCVVKRKGEPKPVRSDFSLADARTAKLIGKAGPWQTYPKRMLKMRARWVLRDTFADVLKGLGLAEEVRDMEPTETPARRQVPSASSMDAAREPETAAVSKPDPISSGPSDFPGDKPMPAVQRAPALTGDEVDWLHGLGGAFSGSEDLTELAEHEQRLMKPFEDKVSKAAWDLAAELLQEHVERINEETKS